MDCDRFDPTQCKTLIKTNEIARKNLTQQCVTLMTNPNILGLFVKYTWTMTYG